MYVISANMNTTFIYLLVEFGNLLQNVYVNARKKLAIYKI